VAISFLTGQRLTADLLNANLVDFQPVQYVKTAATARSSTVTLAADPELQTISIGTGTWRIDAVFYFTVAAAASGGLRTQWAFSGTWNTPLRLCQGPGSNLAGVGTNGPSRILENTSMTYNAAQNADYQMGNSTGAFTAVREDAAEVVVSVAGNLSLQWAQNTSSANATTLRNGSFFRITKVA